MSNASSLLVSWTKHHLKNQVSNACNSPTHWKLYVEFDQPSVTKLRTFLRHHGFQEYPLKTTRYFKNEVVHYTSVVPHHPTTKLHVHSEKQLFKFEKKFLHYQARLVQVEHLTLSPQMVEIDEMRVEAGSVFKRRDLDLIIGAVETIHHEKYGSPWQKNKKSLITTLQLTWCSSTSLAEVTKLLESGASLLEWFDF